MHATNRMASTSVTLVIKEMLHEQDELMLSTNTLIGSPLIKLEAAFNHNMEVVW